ncbi:MAG: alpha/beta hydrolase [Syntrophorhabdaceae bacterium]|nr:alpha/beta hydrolase [Syntrophorhabdaceae bacterium]
MQAHVKRSLFIVIIAVALAYLGLTVMIYFQQDGMIYVPEKTITHNPHNIGLVYEEVSVRTKDGLSISGWYIPAKNEKAVILFCHGNAGNISSRLDSIRIFNDLSLSVLIFDYRGYGRSEGRPSEAGTYLDAEAAWDYLVNVKKIPPGRIIVYGRSLGGAVAAEIALRRSPAALIVESGFTSVPDLGQKIYPWLPVRLISKFRYATIDKIGTIKCPKLIIHSRRDDIVPFEHGRALYEKASPPKEFLEIRGGHNDGFLLSGMTYTGGMEEFLERYVYIHSNKPVKR